MTHPSLSYRLEREAALRERFAGVDDVDLSNGAEDAGERVEVVRATILHLEREQRRLDADVAAMVAELARRERERRRS